MKTQRRILAIPAILGLTLSALVLAAAPSQAINGSKLQITKVKFDSDGSDFPVTNAKLNDEYVRIKNTDTVRRSLSQWTLRDDSNHVYTFPDGFSLAAGTVVYVQTGSGSDTAHHLYQDRGYYIWNNTHDRARLRNTEGGGGSVCKWYDSTPGQSILCNQ